MTAPGKPTVTAETASPGSVSVAFSVPTTSGGSRITSYTTQCVSTDGGVSVSKVGGTTSPVLVGNLTGSKNYQCRVKATNAFGTGTYSSYGAVVLVPPPAVPGKPTLTGETPASGAVNVAFSAPASNGGSAITSYTSQCVSTDGGVSVSKVGGSNSPVQVTGLTGGKHYQCRVKATNAVGTGLYTAYGDIVLVGNTAPGKPTVTGETPSARAISVAFSAPASNGGSAITAYTSQCVSTDGGVSVSKVGGATSPVLVGSLTGGKHYQCRVKATNAVGTGTYSTYGDIVLVPTA